MLCILNIPPHLIDFSLHQPWGSHNHWQAAKCLKALNPHSSQQLKNKSVFKIKRIVSTCIQPSPGFLFCSFFLSSSLSLTDLEDTAPGYFCFITLMWVSIIKNVVLCIYQNASIIYIVVHIGLTFLHILALWVCFKIIKLLLILTCQNKVITKTLMKINRSDQIEILSPLQEEAPHIFVTLPHSQHLHCRLPPLFVGSLQPAGRSQMFRKQEYDWRKLKIFQMLCFYHRESCWMYIFYWKTKI